MEIVHDPDQAVGIRVPWYAPPPKPATDAIWWKMRLWQLDQRWFAWNSLPGLGRLPFIKKSYIILVLFPILHSVLSPMFKAKLIAFNIPSVCVMFDRYDTMVCEQSNFDVSKAIKISTSIAYNWYLIYILTLFLTIGLILYEVFRPKIVGDEPTNAKYLKVIYNFRDVAVNLKETARQNHFVHNFLWTFALNADDLLEAPEDLRIKPVPPYGSPIRMDRRSIYYCAHKMTLREHYLEDALSMTMWYSNELRLWPRRLCGFCFLIAIFITIYLFMEGVWKVLFT